MLIIMYSLKLSNLTNISAQKIFANLTANWKTRGQTKTGNILINHFGNCYNVKYGQILSEVKLVWNSEFSFS